MTIPWWLPLIFAIGSAICFGIGFWLDDREHQRRMRGRGEIKAYFGSIFGDD